MKAEEPIERLGQQFRRERTVSEFRQKQVAQSRGGRQNEISSIQGSGGEGKGEGW